MTAQNSDEAQFCVKKHTASEVSNRDCRCYKEILHQQEMLDFAYQPGQYKKINGFCGG